MVNMVPYIITQKININYFEELLGLLKKKKIVRKAANKQNVVAIMLMIHNIIFFLLELNFENNCFLNVPNIHYQKLHQADLCPKNLFKESAEQV